MLTSNSSSVTLRPQRIFIIIIIIIIKQPNTSSGLRCAAGGVVVGMGVVVGLGFTATERVQTTSERVQTTSERVRTTSERMQTMSERETGLAMTSKMHHYTSFTTPATITFESVL